MAGELRLVLGAVRRVRAVLRADRRPDRHRWRKLPPRRSSDGWRFQLAPTANARRLSASKRMTRSARPMRWRWNAPRAGDPGKLWVVSKKQESGRGRRGRAWATPEGNLAATLLMVLERDLQHRGHARLRCRARACRCARCGRAERAISIGVDGGSGQGVNRFELKWPNDVLASGAKLAGILLESTLLRQERLAVAIGIGVNVVAHPSDAALSGDLACRRSAPTCDAETLFLALSDAWSENERLWGDGRGLGDDPPALADARRGPGQRGCRAGRRQCGARHVRDHRRGLPLRRP